MTGLALMLKTVQSGLLVYTWTMAMQFSFKYWIDPKDHKSEEKYKAIVVEGAIWPKLQLMPRIGWFSPADGGVTSEH